MSAEKIALQVAKRVLLLVYNLLCKTHLGDLDLDLIKSRAQSVLSSYNGYIDVYGRKCLLLLRSQSTGVKTI